MTVLMIRTMHFLWRPVNYTLASLNISCTFHYVSLVLLFCIAIVKSNTSRLFGYASSKLAVCVGYNRAVHFSEYHYSLNHARSLSGWFLAVRVWTGVIPHDIRTTLFMAALCNRAGLTYFHAVVSSSFFFFFSSPNLCGRRLDVYHTSTHGVALV